MKTILGILTVFLMSQTSRAACTCQLEGSDCVVKEDSKFVASVSASQWNGSCQEACKPGGILGTYCPNPVKSPIPTPQPPVPSEFSSRVPEGYIVADGALSLRELPLDSYFFLKTPITFISYQNTMCLKDKCDSRTGIGIHLEKSPFPIDLKRILAAGMKFTMKGRPDGTRQYYTAVSLIGPNERIEVLLGVNSSGVQSIKDVLPWFEVFTPPEAIIK